MFICEINPEFGVKSELLTSLAPFTMRISYKTAVVGFYQGFILLKDTSAAGNLLPITSVNLNPPFERFPTII